ncbi:zinc-binding alcohol dehydrogenase family protein [Limoniibacter endophyticus]|uniref:Zinc-type alcohol dehydrogenase-like protein n=1 Tax=Limoniibacter endophyticus TaxID=1565040 RepID=A0A8J3DGI9_9HYPH|nr:zinc-binding alcohol dehydrogenase family protein [Limoniibacter endophyticus]GHC64679.1 Zn-dependent oxidoreductase [Limoniibacter endophyticus]
MKAVGYYESLPITDDKALIDVELDKPEARGRDLLVKVHSVSVNPVDTKVRKRAAGEAGKPKILGFDASGTIEAVGEGVTGYRVGEEVFYAGSIARSGTNVEYHLVDERIAGKKPASLSFPQAAAMPLTTITAYEMLFERLKIKDSDKGKTLLIIGGAGGVGSMAIQLARKLTDLTIIATASRDQSRNWCRELGAHHVVDHGENIATGVKALGINTVDYIFSITHTDRHFPAIIELIAPQGCFGLIDDPDAFDVRLLKGKSVSLHWESMFTRSVFGTPDMERQRELLDQVSKMVDAGEIRTTLSEEYGKISAANLKRAHAQLESGHSTGKIVLSGF